MHFSKLSSAWNGVSCYKHVISVDQGAAGVMETTLNCSHWQAGTSKFRLFRVLYFILEQCLLVIGS
jgi:hypothetical protein